MLHCITHAATHQAGPSYSAELKLPKAVYLFIKASLQCVTIGKAHLRFLIAAPTP